ncbi:MAG: WecB/TagA/CpsF family glycosyltransferase [Flavobacteriia bacterium]|nr:WecB/TagA/CpsF family glycosyltransferase [Flavobacteriia bacterium]
MEKKFDNYDILGIPISAVTPHIASKILLDWSRDKTGRYVGVREVASLMSMRESEELLDISRNAAMNLPDGMPLVWIGKHRGYNVERTCGPDFMQKIISEHEFNQLTHFFYGGKPGVAKDLKDNFEKKYPGVRVVGTISPPFRELTSKEENEVIRQINKTKADVVWVGISSPKQDIWMFRNHTKTHATMIGVGAAFDFHSGQIKRAPKWMQHYGLEWLHRLKSEPRRLWKRYLVLAPKFIFQIAKQKFNSSRQNTND